MTLFLCLLLIATLAMPFFARSLERVHWMTGVDGFVLVTVVGIITLTLLPDALAGAGPAALLVVLAAFLLPVLGEKIFRRSEHTLHRLLLIVATSALVAHGAGDGFILHLLGDSKDSGFILAGLGLHRMAAALSLWWLMYPLAGRTLSFALLAALAGATALGFFAAGNIDTIVPTSVLGYWQALAAGSLLHIVMHPLGHRHAARSAASQHAHRYGTGLGLLLLIALFLTHGAGHTVGDTHLHGPDILLRTGYFLAPILCLMVLAGAGLSLRLPRTGKVATPNVAPLDKSTLSRIFAGAKLWLAPSVLLWLVTGFVFIGFDYSPAGNILKPISAAAPLAVGQILFYLWAAVAVCVVVLEGGRSFMGRVTALLGHKHTHSHTHGHAHHHHG